MNQREYFRSFIITNKKWFTGLFSSKTSITRVTVLDFDIIDKKLSTEFEGCPSLWCHNSLVSLPMTRFILIGSVLVIQSIPLFTYSNQGPWGMVYIAQREESKWYNVILSFSQLRHREEMTCKLQNIQHILQKQIFPSCTCLHFEAKAFLSLGNPIGQGVILYILGFFL